MGRASLGCPDGIGPASPPRALTPASPTPRLGSAPGARPGAKIPGREKTGLPWTDHPVAVLPPSYHLTGTALGRDPAVLTSRRGGTDEFLGRGDLPRSRPAGNGGAADPWKSVWCSRGLTPRGEPVRCSRERVGSRAVPVVTPRRKEISARAHGPYLDRRGHKRVRRCPRNQPLICVDTIHFYELGPPAVPAP